jgi:hypothetical protein
MAPQNIRRIFGIGKGRATSGGEIESHALWKSTIRASMRMASAPDLMMNRLHKLLLLLLVPL